MYLAVRAFQKVLQNGYRFDEPESVVQARENYMSENSTVIGFFEECMCERPDGEIRDKCTASVVYNIYKAWCIDNNNGHAKSAKDFRETIAKLVGGEYNDITIHTKIGTCYRSLTLTNETKEKYRKIYPGDAINDSYS